MKRIVALITAFLLVGALPAVAQNVTAKVVASCGSETIPLTPGSAPLRMDQTNKLCTSGAGGGGAGDASASNQTLQITQETAINTVLGLQANSTWDGSSAATMMSIARYQGVKLEAVRALLAGTLTTNATLAAETTKVIGTVRVASGGIASGAVASGAIASGAVSAGALATGAGVDGWDITQGTKADSVCGSATGTCSVVALLKFLNTAAGLPLPVQTGIGNVNIGAVQSAGSMYEKVQASATAQVLGPTGATGDYLSHCVIYPATSTPGSVTVFDNANANATNVIDFAGGASSVSNLTPISVPVGAISTAGAWKVTTTTNVSVACYGKFT